ncbi:MAG: hypothetical protein ND866_06635 [Pyrinomonadaceae bacterium]|nr:hypothetical protein [Pyrinomonadaceae bacterium]
MHDRNSDHESSNVFSALRPGSGLTGAGIGLRKQGTNATINDFGIEGMGATSSPGVENFVGGLNPGSADGIGDGSVNGVLLISAASGFSNCSSAPLIFSPEGVEPYDTWLSRILRNTTRTTCANGVEEPSWPTPNSFTSGGIEKSLATAISGSTSYSLSQRQLDLVAPAAVERWLAAGLTREQKLAMRELRFEVGELAGSYLGEARGNRIIVDRDAGGKGWFIDATPMDDMEFGNAISGLRRYTDPAGAPAGHIDLLTAIMHEMGHRVGLTDSYSLLTRDDLMYGYLTKGERRLPLKAQALSAIPNRYSGTNFLSVEPYRETLSQRIAEVVTGYASPLVTSPPTVISQARGEDAVLKFTAITSAPLGQTQARGSQDKRTQGGGKRVAPSTTPQQTGAPSKPTVQPAVPGVVVDPGVRFVPKPKPGGPPAGGGLPTPPVIVGDNLTWNVGTLPAGQSVTITFQVVVDDPFMGARDAAGF